MGTRTTSGIGLVALALAAGVVQASGATARDEERLGANAIVFSSLRGGNDDIYVRDVDGSDEQRLTTAEGQDGAPTLSPDRRTIAFASERTGRMQLWAMDADGDHQRQLLASESFDYHPAWSHDGVRVLFQRQSAATGFDLWVLDLASGAERRLTSLPRNEVGAYYSPDDRQVLFVGNNSASRDVWVVPATGGSPVNLTADVCVIGTVPCVPSSDFFATWTPDGRVLFVSDRSGTTGIWTMAADGTDARLVADLGTASVAMPAMSSNGRFITYVSDAHQPGGPRNVHVMKSDGTHQRLITDEGDDLAPTFAGS